MLSCDILIIGGGLAGNTLACALSELPLKVVLVDNQPPQQTTQLNFDTRSLALAYRSRRLLEHYGVWSSQLEQQATPIEQIHVSDRGLLGNTCFTAKEQGVPALGYVVPLPHLQTALQERLTQVKQFERIQPAQLERIKSYDEERVVVEININGQIQTIQTQLLVAADGAHSAIRQHCQIPVNHHDYGQTAIVSTVGLARSHANSAYERFTAQGPIALLPLSGQRCGLVWAMATDKVAAYEQLSDEAFLTAFQEAFGYRLGRFNQIGKRLTYPVKMQLAEQQIKPGIVLLGNAARTLHPIAGQGYNLILRDIIGLQRTLTEAVRQQQALGSLITLQHYLALRQADQQRIIRFTDQLVRLFSNRRPLLTLGRNLGLLAFSGFPKVKQYWLGWMMKGR